MHQMVDVSEFDNEYPGPVVVSIDLSREFFNSDHLNGRLYFSLSCD